MLEFIIAAACVLTGGTIGATIMALFSAHRVTELENENAALRRRLMEKDGVIFYAQEEE